jgi:hypothetical protein
MTGYCTAHQANRSYTPRPSHMNPYLHHPVRRAKGTYLALHCWSQLWQLCHSRDQAFHLLLPWPLRNSTIQNAIGMGAMAHQWGPLEESVVAQEDDGVGQKKRKAKDIGNGNENVDGVSPWLLCCPPYPAVLASMYDMGSRGACGCTSFIMINNEGRSPRFFQVSLLLVQPGVGNLLLGVADLP